MFNNSDFRAERCYIPQLHRFLLSREFWDFRAICRVHFGTWSISLWGRRGIRYNGSADERLVRIGRGEALWPRWHLERFPISPESIHLVRDVTVLRTWLWSTKLGSQTRLTPDYSRRGRIRVRAYLCVRNEKKRVAKRRNFDTESSTVKNTTDINCKALQGTSLSREIPRISHGIEFNDTAHMHYNYAL